MKLPSNGFDFQSMDTYFDYFPLKWVISIDIINIDVLVIS